MFLSTYAARIKNYFNQGSYLLVVRKCINVTIHPNHYLLNNNAPYRALCV